MFASKSESARLFWILSPFSSVQVSLQERHLLAWVCYEKSVTPLIIEYLFLKGDKYLFFQLNLELVAFLIPVFIYGRARLLSLKKFKIRAWGVAGLVYGE
jgi:hypothetical protein